MTTTAKTSHHVHSLLASAAINLAIYGALAAGFSPASAPQATVVELPSVTVVGKRLPDSATMLAATHNPTQPCNAKL